MHVGRRQDGDGPGRPLEFLLGLQVHADQWRGGHDAARHDLETGPGQHGFDPVGPHPVLGRVAQVDLGQDGRLPPGEELLVLQPPVIRDRPQRGDLAFGDRVGDPLERGEQRGRRARVVAKGGQDLLERVERLVRDLDRGPVQSRAVLAHPGREALESHPGQRPADVQLLLLAVLDAHRHRQYADVPVPVTPADLLGHIGRAFDALIAEREADGQYVGELDRADVGHVRKPGPAVDEDVVVVTLHVLAHGPEELAAAEAVVEVVPVERHHRRRIVAVLPAGRQEVQPAAVRERPFQRYGVPLDPGALQVPVLAPRSGIDRRRRVLVDDLDDAGSGTDRRLVQERVEELVQARRLQIPVHRQHAFAVAGDDPGHVGHGHGPAGPALVRVEGDDLAGPGSVIGSLRIPRVRPGGAAAVLTGSPSGGRAGAYLRYRFSMIIVISGRSSLKSRKVGIPFAAIRHRRGTPSSLSPRCSRRRSRRASPAALISRSWLFQGTSTLTQGVGDLIERPQPLRSGSRTC